MTSSPPIPAPPKPGVTFRSSANVPRITAQLLGDICTHFSMLEWYVDRTIWGLKGKDRKAGRHDTLYLLNHKRLKKLRAEAIARFGEGTPSQKHYKDLADHIGRLVDVRNIYIHGIWSRGKKKGTRRQRFIATYYSNPNGDAYRATIEEMKSFIVAIAKASADLNRASIAHLGAPLP